MDVFLALPADLLAARRTDHEFTGVEHQPHLVADDAATLAEAPHALVQIPINLGLHNQPSSLGAITTPYSNISDVRASSIASSIRCMTRFDW